MAGIGTHEVIIETPLHSKRMADFSGDHLALVLFACRSGLTALAKKSKYKLIRVLKNHGRQAGSSLEHSHPQLTAAPILPITQKNKLYGSKEYFGRNNQCAYCHIIKFEKPKERRVIVENEHYFAYAPYASRASNGIFILSKRDQRRFELISDTQLNSWSSTFITTPISFDLAIENLPFKMIFHTAPGDEKNENYYHWQMEITPKLPTLAGFELGSGFFINTIPPEVAAGYLRQHVKH